MWTRWLLGFLLADSVAAVLKGDRWTYEVRDEITSEPLHNMTVTAVDVLEAEIVTRFAVPGDPGFRQIVFDRLWNRIDDGDWSYSPSDGTGIRRPLQVGDEWSFTNRARHFRTGILMRTQGLSKVAERETISTQSGASYDTYRIECQMQRVTASYHTDTTVNTNIWYAPAVNRWVRRTWRMHMQGRLRDALSEELTDYSRKS
jgi:hypothetical protein